MKKNVYITVLFFGLVLFSGCSSVIQDIADATYDPAAAEAIRGITDLSDLTVFKIVVFSPSDPFWSQYGDVVITAWAVCDAKLNNITKFEICDIPETMRQTGEVKTYHATQYGPRLSKYVYEFSCAISFTKAKTMAGKKVQLIFSSNKTSVPFIYNFPYDYANTEKDYSFYWMKTK